MKQLFKHVLTVPPLKNILLTSLEASSSSFRLKMCRTQGLYSNHRLHKIQTTFNKLEVSQIERYTRRNATLEAK